ncbi:hypothetical protein NC652_033315 [Populus alba x Populus x berolinensis]|nr:hypothetical protein NC652_033315 [Populus alba x Populus x berolinensis]
MANENHYYSAFSMWEQQVLNFMFTVMRKTSGESSQGDQLVFVAKILRTRAKISSFLCVSMVIVAPSKFLHASAFEGSTGIADSVILLVEKWGRSNPLGLREMISTVEAMKASPVSIPLTYSIVWDLLQHVFDGSIQNGLRRIQKEIGARLPMLIKWPEKPNHIFSVSTLMEGAPGYLFKSMLVMHSYLMAIDKDGSKGSMCMINHQALPCLLNLLTNNYKKSIKKEACWTISNVTAGNANQIQAVLEVGIIGPLVQLLQNAEFEIKKEAAWAISNATSGGSHEQIKFLVDQGCIKPLCDLLICPDPRIVTVCLEGLENILKVGEAKKNLGNTGNANLYTQMIEDVEGLEKIENLQSHDNNEIYEKAVKILETYWVEDGDDFEAFPPGDASQSGFQFGGTEVPVSSNGFKFT